MSEDPSNAGDAANGGQAGGLLSDPVDVIIDKLLRYVFWKPRLKRDRSRHCCGAR